MPSNPSLYRFIDFIGGNILDASNVSLLQTELGRLGLQGLGQLYNQGTLLNAIFNITGSSIVFTKANSSFHVFAFINGQFEDLGSTISISGIQPVAGSNNLLYLNWSWDIKTSADDSTFVDGVTAEPTIEAGQLSIDVSWTDTSGVPINLGTQFGKNTSPIIIAHFDMSGSPVVATYINGVAPYADGNPNQAGFVRLTDNSGLAPGNTDSRLSDQRTPLDLSVTDTKVKNLISSGFNSTSLPGWIANHVYSVASQIVDSNGNVETVVSVAGTGTSQTPLAPTWNLSLGGQTIDNAGANQVVWVNGGTASTVKYDPATPSQGGVFTDHIIYSTLKEKLTDFLDTVNTSIENTLIALGNHIGKPLGSSLTHPFPTALQVGAAPASHVGQSLGLGTSHPANVNSNTGGFTVTETSPTVSGDAVLLSDSSSARKAAITHSGDMFSVLANAANAQGGNGTNGTAVNTGTLGLMSLIALVLAEHVNYKSHGNNNPHHLNAADIGSVDAAFVDQQVQSIVDDVTAYTDAKTNISVRVVTTPGATFTSVGSAPSGVNAGPSSISGSVTLPLSPAGTAATLFPLGSSTITYVIVTIGNAFEIAFGYGSYSDGQQVALPEPTGWSSANFFCVGSIEWLYDQFYDTRSSIFKCYIPANTRIVSMAQSFNGTQNFVFHGIAGVQAISWRNIAPPPTIISSFDSTAGTFNAGHVGDSVTITGRNFGSTQSGSVVKFNGTPVVTYSSWASNSLIVVVPVGATTGTITVQVGVNTATSPFVFTIT